MEKCVVSLPQNIINKFDSKLYNFLAKVRLHYNSDKPNKIGALAYTYGIDIFIKTDFVDDQILLHEAVHTIQQMQGLVSPNILINGIPVNWSPILEWEADNCLIRDMPIRQEVEIKAVQAIFTFELDLDNKGKPTGKIFNFRYIRTRTNEYLIGKQEGMHTLADGAKNLILLNDVTYTIYSVIIRLYQIYEAYVILPVNAFSSFVYFDQMYKMELREAAREKMEHYLNLIYPLADDYVNNTMELIYYIQNFLNQFEIYEHYSPLVNLVNKDNKGHGEAAAIGMLKCIYKLRSGIKLDDNFLQSIFDDILKMLKKEIEIHTKDEIIASGETITKKELKELIQSRFDIGTLQVAVFLLFELKNVGTKNLDDAAYKQLFTHYFKRLFDKDCLIKINVCNSFDELSEYLPWFNIGKFFYEHYTNRPEIPELAFKSWCAQHLSEGMIDYITNDIIQTTDFREYFNENDNDDKEIISIEDANNSLAYTPKIYQAIKACFRFLYRRRAREHVASRFGESLSVNIYLLMKNYRIDNLINPRKEIMDFLKYIQDNLPSRIMKSEIREPNDKEFKYTLYTYITSYYEIYNKDDLAEDCENSFYKNILPLLSTPEFNKELDNMKYLITDCLNQNFNHLKNFYLGYFSLLNK